MHCTICELDAVISDFLNDKAMKVEILINDRLAHLRK